MGSKAFVFIALLWAVFLLISSEVAARDLAETSTEQKNTEAAAKTNGVDDAKYRGYGGYPGGGHRGNCQYGCCNGGFRPVCRCCSYAGEAVEAETEAKPQN